MFQLLDIELGNDLSVIAALFDAVIVCTVAEDEVERAEQDGFSGAGFTGKRGHASIKIQFELVDDGKISDVQVF